MTAPRKARLGADSLAGRLSALPHPAVVEEILEPQFELDLHSLLPYYVEIELALLVESLRLDLIAPDQAAGLAERLLSLGPDQLSAAASTSLGDLSFAIEAAIEAAEGAAPTWRADRSRNDFQACAQLLYVRRRIEELGAASGELAAAAITVGRDWTEAPMPGFTQYQAAQVISPGFWLSALAESALNSALGFERLLGQTSRCPLGAGAMAGQELEWDRSRLAKLLGFEGIEENALLAVASREAAARLSGETALLGTWLGRFFTDLLAMTASDRRFALLPDSLSGISSAMPQKRNHPVLERIRGRSRRLLTLHLDCLATQHSTPVSNTVEVSKEALAPLRAQLDLAASVLALARIVVEGLSFDAERMRRGCENSMLGSSRLAAHLTLEHGIPNRQAHNLVGASVRALDGEGGAEEVHTALLEEGAELGREIDLSAEQVDLLFSPEAALQSKRSRGSANPAEVDRMLSELDRRVATAAQRRDCRRAAEEDRRQHLRELPAAG